MGIVNRPGFVVPPPVPPSCTGLDGPHRADVIAGLAKRLGWRSGAELGLWDGRTMARVLRAWPHLSMTGVDLWQPQPGNAGPEDYVGWDHGAHEAACRERLAAFGERATIIKARTVDAAKQVPDGSLDFVFFDADHGTEALRADLAAWLPKLKVDGWAIGHDISWPTVRAAVDDMAPHYEIGPDVTWLRPMNGIWPKWIGRRQTRTALVLGGASTLHADIAAALKMAKPDGVVACNDAGAEWAGHLDAWVSLHPNKFRQWMAQREKKGYPAAKRLMAHQPDSNVYIEGLRCDGFKFPGQTATGSSGIFAARAALMQLGFDRAILCGVPMDPHAAHFFDGRAWTAFQRYKDQVPLIAPEYRARMRSLSGWTAQFLGEPDREWLNGGV